MRLYVADLADEVTTEDSTSDTLPVGASDPPDYGFLAESSYLYRTALGTFGTMADCRAVIEQRKPDDLYLYPIGAACEHTTEPTGALESWIDSSELAHIAEGTYILPDDTVKRGWLYGVPFSAGVLTWQWSEDDKDMTLQPYLVNDVKTTVWWRRVYY